MIPTDWPAADPSRRPATLDPADAAFVDVQAGIRLLLLDFDGVLTDNHVFVMEDGREAVRCSRFDGIGLRRLERAGIEAVIVSTEANPVVGARAGKLKVGCRQGLSDKVAAAEALMTERGLDFGACAFLGNDVNDIPLLQRVALPLAVADAHPGVWPCARWLTGRAGGAGAVREICDAFGVARDVPARYP